MTHTLGPWKVVERTLHFGSVNDDGMDTQVKQYDIYAEDKQVTGCGWNIQGKANAALIAAAPELLEALESLYLYVTDREEFEHTHAAPQLDCSLAWEEWLNREVRGPARAAIAKAKGIDKAHEHALEVNEEHAESSRLGRQNE